MTTQGASRIALCLAILAVLFGSAKPAESASIKAQEAVRAQKPLQYEVSVTLKLIQVVVLDKLGNPVTDLRKEDFSLYDNGDPMPLTEFERHIQKIPSSEEVPTAEERIESTSLMEKPALLNRKLIFFFDFGYSSGRGIRKAREEALKFFDSSLLPSDEVAVMSYSLFGRLKVREFLTTDHPKARKAVEAIGLADAAGVVEDTEDRLKRQLKEEDVFADARTGKLTFPGSGGARKTIQDSQTDERQQARMFITYLTSLAQAIRYLPGQKNLILFTMGIPTKLLYRGALQDQYADLRGAYEKLCSELATANIAVFSMDTTDRSDPAYAVPESRRIDSGVSSLRRMAQLTGGEYMGHVDTSEAHFQKIQTLTGAFYILGYPVTESWDGKYHQIKVEVKRPGYEVRAQAGYLNPKTFSEYSKIERELHLVDLALSDRPLGQVPLRFPMTAIITGLGQDGGLCLLARIPLREMREKWKGGPVEVLSLVYDQKDDIIARTRSEERLAETKEGAIILAAWNAVPPGVYRCRAVVRDLETGDAAVGGTTVAVEEAASGLRLLPPMFVQPDRGTRYISQGGPRGVPKKAGQQTIAALLAFDQSQYAPDFKTELLRGSKAWIAIPCAGPKGFGEGLKLTARLVDQLSGAEIPLSLTVLGKTEIKGVEVFFADFDIPEVEPDVYRLIIMAEGKNGQVSMIARDFIIE